MKTILFSVLFAASIPFFVGKLQMYNAISVIQNLTDKTDGEIENVLRVFNYNLTWDETPTMVDVYKSGLLTTKEFILY